MINWQTGVGLSAGVLSVLCVIPYILTTLRGRTRPHRITWWIVSLLSFILAATQYAAGGQNTLWLILGGGIGQLSIACLSIRYGEGGWNKLDRFCLLCLGLSLLIWWRLNVPLLAMLLNIVVDFLGCLPTIHKARTKPETENLLSWSLYFIASLLNLLAIENWSFSHALLPVYIVIGNGTITLFLLKPHLYQILSSIGYQPTARLHRQRLRAKKRLSPSYAFRRIWWKSRSSLQLSSVLLVLEMEEIPTFSRFGTVPNRNYSRKRRTEVFQSATRSSVQPEYSHESKWFSS